MVKCEICGVSYVESDKSDVRWHQRACDKFQAAREKHGADYIMNHGDEEETKLNGWKGVYDKDLPLNERVEAAESIFRAWYSRSIGGSNYSAKHPAFKDYIAMMLHQPHQKDHVFEQNPEIFNELVKKYGTKPGITSGMSYWG